MKRAAANTLLAILSALTLAVVSTSVSAHHSSAMFDPSQSITLQGVVKELRWTNPHAFIRVLVKAEREREEEWSIEMNSPELLARAGWRPETLAAGDALSVVIHPMRDGSRSGQFVSGAGSRGPLLDGPPPAPVSAQTSAPAVGRSSCPRVDVTVVEPRATAETRPVRLGQFTVFVRRNAIVTTSDIAEIKVAGDDDDTLLQIKYKPEAAATLNAATTDHDGLKLAFVVDDDVWLAFTWQGRYGMDPAGTQVSIRHSLAKAQKLVRDCSEAQTR